MSDLDINAIRAREKAASQEVYRLCDGGRFTMTVPPREETDSDTVIIASLSDVDKLADEVARLRRENTALQQIVTRAEKDIATLTRDRDQALEESVTAPRDTDLTQQVRALVKRYGAPVIAAEAARQAKHH